ncbi:MAG: OmpH family outer membrane protein [Nitrospirota bacterium]
MKDIGRKLFTVSMVLAVFCLLPKFTYAEESVKFGAVDVQKVLNESDAGKKAKSDLESLIKSKQTVIDEKGKAIEKLKNDLEKQASVLSADARKNKEDELEKYIREYQRLVQDSQADVKKKETDLTENLLKEIQDMIQKIGEDEGYTMIFERGMVIYSNKGIDLTDAVLKKFDEMKARKK